MIEIQTLKCEDLGFEVARYKFSPGDKDDIIQINPENIRSILTYLSKKATGMVVMANKAVEILRNDYGISNENIKVIPHGIHHVEYEDCKIQKEKLGYQDKILLSSFGLISGSKNYETIIKSLPDVVKQHPNLLYLILGQTHPGILKDEGEKYRNSLQVLIDELGLQNHVKFVNKYLELDELLNYLKASDIFLMSGHGISQITSGTLVYALGCGTPVISHPFLHAQEAINSERGILVNLGDSESYKEAILKLAGNPELRKSMSRKAYEYTRHMQASCEDGR